MHKIVIYISTYLVFGCCIKPHLPIQIKEFTSLMSKGDTSVFDQKIIISDIKTYLIYNYKGSEANERFIDKYAQSIRVKNKSGLNQLTLLFFKYSKKTNEKNLQLNPKDIDRHSLDHDLIFSYIWFGNNAAYNKSKYRNGFLLNPDTSIRIEDVK